jgi:hypothetical protein
MQEKMEFDEKKEVILVALWEVVSVLALYG